MSKPRRKVLFIKPGYANSATNFSDSDPNNPRYASIGNSGLPDNLYGSETYLIDHISQQIQDVIDIIHLVSESKEYSEEAKNNFIKGAEQIIQSTIQKIHDVEVFNNQKLHHLTKEEKELFEELNIPYSIAYTIIKPYTYPRHNAEHSRESDISYFIQSRIHALFYTLTRHAKP